MVPKDRSKLFLLKTIGGVLLFAGAAFLRSRGFYTGSFLLFLFLLVTEASIFFLETRNILDLRLLLTLSWLGGLSLAVLNLSSLQQEWRLKMWFICGGFYFLTITGYEVLPYLKAAFSEKRRKKAGPEERASKEAVSETGTEGEDKTEGEDRNKGPVPAEAVVTERVWQALLILFGLILVSFMIESVKFGFVYPFMSDKPHAYTEFHITGIHYFVVSTPFIHAMSVWYLMKAERTAAGEQRYRKRLLLLIGINLICVLIAVMILSKLQLFFSLVMSFSVWLLTNRRISRKKLFFLLAAGGAAFAVAAAAMIFLRKYPDQYLEGIFEFRNKEIPVAVQYPYMYIVNNFENLNLLTEDLTAFTLGKRILLPFLSLSGLKFIPAVRDFLSVPVFFTKPELTTLTVIYDVYGDFGAAGVYLFALILGMVSAAVQEKARKGGPGSVLLFSQLVIYFALSFFSTWFSNPTVWYYFGLTFLIALWCRVPGRKRKELQMSEAAVSPND